MASVSETGTPYSRRRRMKSSRNAARTRFRSVHPRPLAAAAVGEDVLRPLEEGADEGDVEPVGRHPGVLQGAEPVEQLGGRGRLLEAPSPQLVEDAERRVQQAAVEVREVEVDDLPHLLRVREG